MILAATSALACILAVATAHQNLHQFWVNGVSPGYQVGIRMPPSNSPVTNIKSPDIACNVNGARVPSGVKTIPAAEGDTIKVQWDMSTHPGPITHMLFGPVPDASKATGVGTWFKVDEAGYANGKWANEVMETQNMTYSFRLPRGLPSGEYLLRSEMEALHSSTKLADTQFYVGCMQLAIRGSGAGGAGGAGGCGPTIQLPGAYESADKNIYISNFYYGFNPATFRAPGGPVATCGRGREVGMTTAAATSAGGVEPAASMATEAGLGSAAGAAATSAGRPAAPATTLVTSARSGGKKSRSRVEPSSTRRASRGP